MAERKVVVIGLGYATYKYEQDLLDEVGAEVLPSPAETDDEVAEATRDADAILNRTVDITARAIEGMSKCKVISRYGIGVLSTAMGWPPPPDPTLVGTPPKRAKKPCKPWSVMKHLKSVCHSWSRSVS